MSPIINNTLFKISHECKEESGELINNTNNNNNNNNQTRFSEINNSAITNIIKNNQKLIKKNKTASKIMCSVEWVIKYLKGKFKIVFEKGLVNKYQVIHISNPNLFNIPLLFGQIINKKDGKTLKEVKTLDIWDFHSDQNKLNSQSLSQSETHKLQNKLKIDFAVVLTFNKTHSQKILHNITAALGFNTYKDANCYPIVAIQIQTFSRLDAEIVKAINLVELTLKLHYHDIKKSTLNQEQTNQEIINQLTHQGIQVSNLNAFQLQRKGIKENEALQAIVHDE